MNNEYSIFTLLFKYYGKTKDKTPSCMVHSCDCDFIASNFAMAIFVD
jgi:hypothetical protein